VSTGEPGAGPVTFRAAFIEELRARRTQTGLLQREFAEKAHVSLSSYKKYEQGKKKPERKFATWCDSFYGCPGTFERLYDGMVAESYPSWFGPRVLFEDTAALIGLAIVALGTFVATTTGEPAFDGIASIAIGLLLLVALTFVVLTRKRHKHCRECGHEWAEGAEA
jgi:transcriptional regulator with XRE-family HTH domain